MRALILAGGKGTRLGELSLETPKPMLMIGDKPLLHHQVELLLKYGYSDIVILVNHLKAPIISYFQDGANFGANISYFEEVQPLGTTGGIKELESQLHKDFLVLYGDVMINMDLNRLSEYHFRNHSDCTMVVHPNDHPYDSDLIESDENGRVIAFHSKPHEPGKWYHNMVNAGVYIMSPLILKYLEKNKKADFGRDIFPTVCKKLALFGYQTSEYLKDMGTPERLEKVNSDLKSGRILRSNYEYKQKAIFLDRDGVLNVEKSFISNPDELILYDYTPAAVHKINQSGYLSVVVTNQSAVARNLCTEEDVHTIHKKMETILGDKGAWLDAIYYCPHHPDKGFPEENPVYKIACDCRKPGIGMFQKAITKFNINPAASYMIGDSERDILAGINAGCSTIGVRTGYGIRKTRIFPDYMFDHLNEAVDFIVDDPLRDEFEKISSLYEGFDKGNPWILLIGGNARTGKSTLATYLRIGFEKAGKNVLQVSLDNWILAEEMRTKSMNVYDRFQLRIIENEVKKLAEGRRIVAASYANHEERMSRPVEYDPSNADIIIIEGVVALSSEKIRNMAHLKIFVAMEHRLYARRFYEYYAWRGKSEEETTRLIKKREQDEYQLIEKESKLADLIINSSLS
jgi:D,D-heptose 1,7-bisphosphate phosphatase